MNWLQDIANSFADALRDQLVRLIDPIVLDLDGNGIELTARLESGVHFDMDGDGIRELTGWLSPTDGLLAIDENGNGVIDDIGELIGDLGRSGFAELASYDLNGDEVIDANDAVWADLRVWIDADSDGVTDAGELRTLASLNIRAIDLNYVAVNFTAEGNRIHEQSVFEYTDGTTGLAADIWFDVDNVATDSEISLTGNQTVDDLPDIRGRGDVDSLRSVMATNGALTTLVAGFVAQGIAQLGAARGQTENILYRWAGVEDVDPASRGGLFDGRKLAALEAFLGTPFDAGGATNPTAQAVASLEAAWTGLVDAIMARLLMSGPLGEAMSDVATYVPEIDRLLTVQTPAELLEGFAAIAPDTNPANLVHYWSSVLPLAREIVQDVGGATDDAAYAQAVSQALEGTGLAPFADLIASGVTTLDHDGSILEGAAVHRLTVGDDVVWYGDGQHVILASRGDDLLAPARTTYSSQFFDGGPGDDELRGSSGNDWLDGGEGDDLMAGGAGADVYVVDSLGDVALESSGGGEDEVRAWISWTLGPNFEHLTLLGDADLSGRGNGLANRIVGNAGDNRLEGLEGDDTIDGGAGADVMIGGRGRDLYIVDDAGDVVIETGNDQDTVESSVDYALGSRVEILRLTGTERISGRGNALDNTLFGNDVANTLNGVYGRDYMYGGLGNDLYFVDNASDYVWEEQGAGVDEIRASVDWRLTTYVENLRLIGTRDVDGYGNALANRIEGNAGHNWIDGGGGADDMAGGAGDDVYVVENAGDRVTERANEGEDWVLTTLGAYTLTPHVEHLQLWIGWDDGIDRNGFGNNRDNQIHGTSGANRIEGRSGEDALYGGGGEDALFGGFADDLLDGGTGADRMEGGQGDDRYIVDDAGDVLFEGPDRGTDTVESWVSWTLGAHFENLILLGYANIDGVGNALNNTLVGNDADNSLGGGQGDDRLIGGRGADVYTVDSAGDVVVENSGQGVDEVRALVSWTLGRHVEHLTLLGASDLHGAGNAYANRITGNRGDNRLEGFDGEDTIDGREGDDVMIGGAGRDLYFVDSLGDSIVETGGDVDEVRSSVSWTLGSRLEILRLTGTDRIAGTGNGLDNTLYGNDVANTLNGAYGRDYMYGGLGNDLYFVDNQSDYVWEDHAAGVDEVRASVTWTLATYVENLRLIGTRDIDGYGNALANRIEGNAGHNWIDGGGGADDMAGGAGDDVYVVDDAGDRVSEAANAGEDTVLTSLASYTLTPGVEHLRLWISRDDGGDRDGFGNNWNNTIRGTSGVNRLDGRSGDDSLFGHSGEDVLIGGFGDDHLDGGADADRMEGGQGDDRYIVDDAGDSLLELADEGVDTVESWVSWTLGPNLENLVLLGYSDIDGYGNALGNTLSGNDADNSLGGGQGDDLLIGWDGADVYTVDSAGDVVVEQADGGTDTVRALVSWTLGRHVEHLDLLGAAALRGVGNAASNILTGNRGNNRLEGLEGNDTIDGRAGDDVMIGGAGRDLYIVDSLGDSIVETGDDVDTVESSVSWTLGSRVENLRLTGSDRIDAMGNGLDNTLWGNDVANTLNGGQGRDAMYGGLGNDVYAVDDVNDYVWEDHAAGVDEVRASVTWTLATYIENLRLNGTRDVDGFGNALANRIEGNVGHNRIDGGRGADDMAGGAGDDVYVVDDAGDRVSEAANAGEDWVLTTLVAYTLTPDVEHLQLWISRDDRVDRNGFGNNRDNEIHGTGGANRLEGRSGADALYGRDGEDQLFGGFGDDLLDGGDEADRMEGAQGDDRYIVDDVGDVVVELAGQGVDTVETSLSYILGANLENLVLTGNGTIDGQGNGLDNTLTGNARNNALDGGGGADRMMGGEGDDTYTVDNAGDRVIELPGGGTDTVRSSVDYRLGASVEHLVLIGTSNLSATGNVGGNQITGNAGANVIAGGLGGDLMTGAAGADTFAFRSLLDSDASRSYADRITDFSTAQGDRIDLSGIDAVGSTAADDAFAWIGSAGFTAAGQVRSETYGSSTYVYVNTDDDLNDAEMAIALTGVLSLNAGSFLL